MVASMWPFNICPPGNIYQLFTRGFFKYLNRVDYAKRQGSKPCKFFDLRLLDNKSPNDYNQITSKTQHVKPVNNL